MLPLAHQFPYSKRHLLSDSEHTGIHSCLISSSPVPSVVSPAYKHAALPHVAKPGIEEHQSPSASGLGANLNRPAMGIQFFHTGKGFDDLVTRANTLGIVPHNTRAPQKIGHP